MTVHSTETAFLMLVVTILAVAFLSLVMAIFRKVRGQTIYTSAFFCAAIGFTLLSAQQNLPAWTGLIVANILVILFHAFLVWGLRTLGSLKPCWPKRFWVYLSLCFAALFYFSFIQHSYPIRALIMSLVIILFTTEFFVSLRKSQRPRTKSLYRAMEIVAITYVLCYIVRIVMVLLTYGKVATLLSSNNIATFFATGMTNFYVIMWAGCVLMLDISEFFERLNTSNRMLSIMAHTDALTGLSNRYALDMALADEMERASRYHEPLSLILFDLDYFKTVNDTWGHLVGDNTLVAVARLASEETRRADALFRWGGEEFLLLAPHTDLAGAKNLAEKLRLRIETYDFPTIGHLTASLSVAEWNGIESADDWLTALDTVLYRAKDNGRNRVDTRDTAFSS